MSQLVSFPRRLSLSYKVFKEVAMFYKSGRNVRSIYPLSHPHEGIVMSSNHLMPAEMKLINFTSYLNGFTVTVDVQLVSAAGRRAIGRVREIACVCEREGGGGWGDVRTELLSLA